MIKLALAEDNNFLAQTITEKISFFDDLKLKFRGINGARLLQQLEEDHNLDVILMDIQMPEMDGIQTTEIVKSKYPHIKVVMLTVFDDEQNIFNAIRAGADGYLLKDSNAGEIHDGIKEIMDGGAPLSPSIALKALKLLRNPLSEAELESNKTAEDYHLTTRETETLEQLSKGLDYKEIAENLHISTGTVRKHLENTYRKLRVHNKMEAVNKARKERLI